jgi:ubiquitin carboxyl-terminal hydrolase 5/13
MDAIGMAEGGICPCWTPDHVTDNLQGRMIYKDECCKCFNSPYSKDGLDVCLKSLVGACRETHAKMIAQQKGHPLVLNIKKVPVENQGLTKVTKLAIGKPGGVDADADKYETRAEVYCYHCNLKLDTAHAKVKPIVDSILLAQSALEASTVQEWELELQACECTLTLDQSGAKKIAAKSAATCEDCDLRNNLWLNLSSGHIGCGRRNWDGSGGNNHALEHFKATGNGLCVKLGTITPEGKASIHCYKCDEEVLDFELAKHLAVLGIDVQSQVKTEKSIAEQELEANLNLTLSKVIEEGKSLVPVFGPLNTGMQNLGNTCYMNSIVQVLFS